MSYFRRAELELKCLQWEDDEDGFAFFDIISEKKKIEIEGIGVAEFVESHRPEGEYDEDHDGEYIDVVFKIGDRYFRKSGTYNSWDADEWDGPFEEVKPAKIQRTEWVNINKRN